MIEWTVLAFVFPIFFFLGWLCHQSNIENQSIDASYQEVIIFVATQILSFDSEETADTKINETQNEIKYKRQMQAFK